MNYPPVLSVFQHRDFQFSTDRRIAKRPALRPEALLGGNAYERNLFYSQIKGSCRDLAGTLRGEFLLLANAVVLIDRDGAPITTSGKQYEGVGARVDEHCGSVDFINEAADLVRRWDEFPIIDGIGVLSDMYSGNYYHWTAEMMPRIRLIDRARVQTIAVSSDCLSQNAQRSLLALAAGGFNIAPLSAPVRVRDPFFVDGLVSEEGLLWLRKQTKLVARRGERRIYIRRGQAGTRSHVGGGISETPGLLQMLVEHAFEIVEFDAAMTIQQQVGLLDGAGVILAAHGAALTNLCYQEPGVRLVEVLGSATPRGVYMEIAELLDFEYLGYLAQDVDDRGDMIVDLGWLQNAIQR